MAGGHTLVLVGLLVEKYNYLTTTHVLRSNLAVAFVVGRVVMLINQGDYILMHGFSSQTWLKIAMTYAIPFLVSSYTSAKAKWVFRPSEPVIYGGTYRCELCDEVAVVAEREIMAGEPAPPCPYHGKVGFWYRVGKMEIPAAPSKDGN